MEEALAHLVKSLVHHPEQVEVRAAPRDSRNTMLEIYVADGDMGPVIGRQGRTIKALRAIFAAVSEKQQHRFTLDVVV